MIRVLHTADIHIGIEKYGHTDPSTGLNTRLNDFLKVFDEVVDYAINEQVDLFLFAGDAYKARDPNPTHQREFATRIHRLAKAGIPVLLLIGNHDVAPAIGRATSVDIFETLQVPNVTVASRPKVHVVETRNGPLQVAALPWIQHSTLMTRDEYRNKTMEEIKSNIAERIALGVDNLVEQLDPKLPAILTAHISVDGATVGSERSVMLGQDVTVLRSVLAREAFNYVALGHIHKHQVLGNTPPVVYSGSLERIDFGEEKEEKGFCVVHLPEGGADEEGKRSPANFFFQKTGARHFQTIKLTPGADDPTADVLHMLERYELEDAIVRLEIKVDDDVAAKLRDNEIRKVLHERKVGHIAAISREIDESARSIRRTTDIASRTDRELLEIYFRDKNVGEDRLKKLLEYGDRIITGARQA